MSVARCGCGRIVTGMHRLRRALFVLLLTTAPSLRASPPARVDVPELRTSIYVGSVRLTNDGFRRESGAYVADYEARVFPWVFWGERGRISISVADADFERLARGEQVDFTGEALNHKGKPRTVTGHARPVDPRSGLLKVRIRVDDLELIFNGPYRFQPDEGSAAGPS